MTGWIKPMQQAGSPSARRPAPTGWLVQVRSRYYTGHGHSQFEQWTPFPRFAKVYRRRAWAQKIAAQLGGEAVAVAEQLRTSER
jgi:hypothetical protein